MERRGFLKRIFGAAVIAAMPKIVVDEIERLPVEEVPVKPPTTERKPPFAVDEYGDKMLFIYDQEKLVAYSISFDVKYAKQLSYYIDSITEAPVYTTPPWEWSIYVEKLKWSDHRRGIEYFTNNDPLKCIMIYKGVKVEGQVYIQECKLTYGIESPVEEDVVLRGCGSLFIEKNDDN